MSIEKFLQLYYIFILGIFPAIFYWLAIWTCYDIFWTSLMMIMVQYLLITIYFFKFQDNLINNLLLSKLNSLFTTDVDFKSISKGIFIGLLEFFVFILFLYQYYPIHLPIPNNIHSFGNILYFGFIAIFYCILNEIMTELYYNIFLNYLCGFKIKLIFINVLLFFQITFFSQNYLIWIIFIIYCIIKENFKEKIDFNNNIKNRIGNKFGFWIGGTFLLILNNLNLLNIVQSHPKNNWKG